MRFSPIFSLFSFCLCVCVCVRVQHSFSLLTARVHYKAKYLCTYILKERFFLLALYSSLLIEGCEL